MDKLISNFVELFNTHFDLSFMLCVNIRHLRQSLNLFPGFCECTERTGNPIPYIAI